MKRAYLLSSIFFVSTAIALPIKSHATHSAGMTESKQTFYSNEEKQTVKSVTLDFLENVLKNTDVMNDESDLEVQINSLILSTKQLSENDVKVMLDKPVNHLVGALKSVRQQFDTIKKVVSKTNAATVGEFTKTIQHLVLDETKQTEAINQLIEYPSLGESGTEQVERTTIPREMYAEASIEEVVASAPQGVRTTDLFRQADAKSNNSEVITNKETNTDVVIITNDSGSQTGAIWSTKNYRIDLSKSFHSEMKVYFGNQKADAADGMAFVLQNSPDVSSEGDSDAIGSGGSSLGVMGKDTSPWSGDVIQNSFAIEMDTHVNGGGLDAEFSASEAASSFHIASYYPAIQDSYDSKKKKTVRHSKYSDVIKYDKANHKADGKWHDFKIDYKKVENDDGTTSYKFSYGFKDLDAEEWVERTIYEEKDSGKTEYPNDSLELSRLGVTEEKPYVYWGFTGATGKKSAVNAVVFTELPDLGGTDNEMDVMDSSGVSVNETVDKVHSGNDLMYNYTVDFNDGKQTIGDITLNGSLNEYVELDQSKEVMVSYNDEPAVPMELEPQGEDFETGFKLSHLGPLGPEVNEDSYQSIHISVPVKADADYELEEPIQVTDNMTVAGTVGDKANREEQKVQKSSVSYTISPFEDGFLLPVVSDRKWELSEAGDDKVTSPVEKATKSLTGDIKFKNTGEVANYQVKITGVKTVDGKDKEILVPVTEKEGLFSFKYDLTEDDELLAGTSLRYDLIDEKETVILSNDQAVLDGTPPTGELKEEVYTSIGKYPKEATVFLKKKSDSNPSLKPEDIVVSYTDTDAMVEAVKTATGEDEKREVSVTLKDPAGNSRVVKEDDLIVLELDAEIWLETTDLSLYSKELISNSPNPNAPNPDRQLLPLEELTVLLTQKVKAKKLDLEQGQIIDVELTSLSISGLNETGYLPGIYTITVTGKSGDDSVSGTFNLTVKDGELSLKLLDSFKYEVKISTQKNKTYYSLNSVTLAIADDRYAMDGWTVQVSADKFSDGSTTIEPEKIDLVLDSGDNENSVIGDEGFTFGEEDKSFSKDLADQKAGMSLSLKLAESSIWASNTDEFSTNLDWLLSPVDSKKINQVSYGIPTAQ